MFAAVHFPIIQNSKIPVGSKMLIAITDKISPLFEIIDERTVVINIDGLHLVYPGGIGEILKALEIECRKYQAEFNISTGNSLTQSLIGSLCLKGVSQINSVESLTEIDVIKLPLSKEYKSIFADWGIKTVKQLLELPRNELVARLGREIGDHLGSLTGNGRKTPITPPALKKNFAATIDFDDAVENIDLCLFPIEEKLKNLMPMISAACLAASEIEIMFFFAYGKSKPLRIKLPIPTLGVKYLVKLLSYEFEKFDPGDLIRSIKIEIETAPPRITQLRFWKPPEPEPEELELTLAKLRSELGETNVGIPVTGKGYNPADYRVDHLTRPKSDEDAAEEALLNEKRLYDCLICFRYFLTRIPVEFTGNLPKPYNLNLEGRKYPVDKINGPWLSSGNWWNGDKIWVRSEMDVALKGGQIFRIVESKNGKFYAEGYYD